MVNGDSCSNFNKGEKIFCCVAHFFFFLLLKNFESSSVLFFYLHLITKLKLCYALQVVVGLC
jgi:hypothetical protein